MAEEDRRGQRGWEEEVSVLLGVLGCCGRLAGRLGMKRTREMERQREESELLKRVEKLTIGQLHPRTLSRCREHSRTLSL